MRLPNRLVATTAILAALAAGCGSSELAGGGADDVTIPATALATSPAATLASSPVTTAPNGAPIPIEPDGGIGDTPLGDVPFFGGNDAACASPTLKNGNEDQQLLDDALDCFFTEYEAERPVVVDLSIPTTEGDPIYFRYLFDGDAVTIVEDNRLDAFGVPNIRAQRCNSIERGDWLPRGIDCTDIVHPGFPEAS